MYATRYCSIEAECEPNRECKRTQKDMKGLRKRPQKKIGSLKGSPENSHSTLQIRCKADGLSTGALADGSSTDVLTTQNLLLWGPIKRPLLTICHKTARLQWARDHMGWRNIRLW